LPQEEACLPCKRGVGDVLAELALAIYILHVPHSEDHLLTAGIASYQYDVDGFLATKKLFIR